MSKSLSRVGSGLGVSAEELDEIIRAKWTIDGATTLTEAAKMLRKFADRLQSLHDDGYVLRQPVEDDYGFYYKPEETDRAS
jgi:hypothetical protein